MEDGEALIFPRCRQVHTFGMRFAIDVLFVDRNGKVVRAVSELTPGRLTRWVPRARALVELPPGTLSASGTRASDLIRIDGPDGAA